MSLSNHVQYMATAAHGHQSNYQGQTAVLRHENDIEKRIQATIARDGVRIREFFIDFDKLRKGVVGEAAVSLQQLSRHQTAHRPLNDSSESSRFSEQMQMPDWPEMRRLSVQTGRRSDIQIRQIILQIIT